MVIKNKICYVLPQPLFYFVILSATRSVPVSRSLSAIGKKTLNNTVVLFDPYVSILDSGNRFRYNVSDLVPLVANVAKRFNKILVQLSETDMAHDVPTSLSLSPLAAAEYNRLSANGNIHKLDVWLSYCSGIPDYTYESDDIIFHKKPRMIIERLISLANQANAVFRGTVEKILLPYNLLLNDMDNLLAINGSVRASLLSAVKLWGIVVDRETLHAFLSFNMHMTKLRPNIVITHLRPLRMEQNFFGHFQGVLRDLNRINGGMLHGLFMTTSDTDRNGVSNVSSLVTIWTEAMNWAENNGTTLIVSKAYDTPYEADIEKKTGGLLRLIENHSYNSTSEYVFEDKVESAEFEKKINVVLNAPGDLNCSTSHVGIIFSLYDKKKYDQLKKWSPGETDMLLEKTLQKFNKLAVIVPDDSRQGVRAFSDDLIAIERLRDVEIEVTLIFLPHVYLSKMIRGAVSDSGANTTDYRRYVKQVKTYVVSYMGNDTEENESHLKYLIFVGLGIEENEYKFGYAFNVSTCLYYETMGAEEQELLNTYLTSERADTILFYFEEDEHTVKLGADRMFQQRIVVLEECRKLLSSRRKFEHVQLTFMMLHYATNLEFYQSRREIVNYVEYLQMLSDWAVKKNTSVILNNAMDGDRYFKEKGHFEREIGWLRYDNANGMNKSVFLDKVEDFQFRFSNSSSVVASSGMETYQLILIIVVPVVLTVTAVTLSFLGFRRKYREKYLSKLEIDEFFNGTENDEEKDDDALATRFPYDKSRYEISTDNFEIDAGNVLGSGEFGKVTRGKVDQDGKLFDAAIKTLICRNVHKTAIRGLLSEIKVLSFVGRHDNIIELLGANTEDIKNGNVFVFLELCEMGSLQNYLRTMTPPPKFENDYCCIESIQVEEKSVLDKRVGNYLNAIFPDEKMHPNCLTEMRRWSLEICSGMEYLASKHIVHADLATRNILLNNERVAKICDFGLSRRMYNYASYVKTQQEPLPWKWMAPESLRRLEFSEKSDVWAYGVTLWEIYSLGDIPYPGLSWSLEFADELEGGLRLQEPKYSHQNAYFIMKECWQQKKESRPTFSEILDLYK